MGREHQSVGREVSIYVGRARAPMWGRDIRVWVGRNSLDICGLVSGQELAPRSRQQRGEMSVLGLQASPPDTHSTYAGLSPVRNLPPAAASSVVRWVYLAFRGPSMMSCLALIRAASSCQSGCNEGGAHGFDTGGIVLSEWDKMEGGIG